MQCVFMQGFEYVCPCLCVCVGMPMCVWVCVCVVGCVDVLYGCVRFSIGGNLISVQVCNTRLCIRLCVVVGFQRLFCAGLCLWLLPVALTSKPRRAGLAAAATANSSATTALFPATHRGAREACGNECPASCLYLLPLIRPPDLGCFVVVFGLCSMVLGLFFSLYALCWCCMN